MNLPISKPVVENVSLDLIDPYKLFQDLYAKKFTGFIFLTTHTEYNFEESILLFLKGNIAGSIYLNNTYNVEVFGKTAFDLSLNSLSNKIGNINIYQLSEEQLKLILIFNDNVKYNFGIDPKALSKIKFTYLPELFKNTFTDKMSVVHPRGELFDKFNISELQGL